MAEKKKLQTKLKAVEKQWEQECEKLKQTEKIQKELEEKIRITEQDEYDDKFSFKDTYKHKVYLKPSSVGGCYWLDCTDENDKDKTPHLNESNIKTLIFMLQKLIEE